MRMCACRHLKLRNPTVAAEIFSRLLQNPSVPQREREVALRKLAVCETMLESEHAPTAARAATPATNGEPPSTTPSG